MTSLRLLKPHLLTVYITEVSEWSEEQAVKVITFYFVEPAEYSGRSFGPGGRYSFQTVGDSHSIVIQDVQARDKGLFQCTLVPTQSNNFVHKTKAITLTVLGWYSICDLSPIPSSKMRN